MSTLPYQVLNYPKINSAKVVDGMVAAPQTASQCAKKVVLRPRNGESGNEGYNDRRGFGKNIIVLHGTSMTGELRFRVRRNEKLTGPPASGSSLARMLMRKPKMLVAIALANKMARTIWAMLTKQEDYREQALPAMA